MIFCSCLDAFLFVSFVSWYTLFRILSADFHALARRSGFLPCPYCLLQAPPARSGLGITNAGEQIRPAKRNGKKTEGENTDDAEDRDRDVGDNVDHNLGGILFDMVGMRCLRPGCNRTHFNAPFPPDQNRA